MSPLRVQQHLLPACTVTLSVFTPVMIWRAHNHFQIAPSGLMFHTRLRRAIRRRICRCRIWVSHLRACLPERTCRGLCVSRTQPAMHPGGRPVSSQSWLTVTSSGVSPGDLNLTANVGSLAPGFYEARVTVSLSNSAIVNSESVRVGLYVSNTASANVFVNGAGASNSIVDPIRPYLYSIAGSTVYVNHVYTGALVATINIVGSDLRSVAVSHDGSHLYVVDAVSKGIVTVDLDQQTVVGTNTYPQYDNLQVTTISQKFASPTHVLPELRYCCLIGHKCRLTPRCGFCRPS